MKYGIVRLPEKTVSGLAVRTNNFSPDMGQAMSEECGNVFLLGASLSGDSK